MKFPQYDPSIEARTNPLDELIHLYADREKTALNLARRKASWSTHIGELCLSHKQRDFARVDKVMRTLPEGSVLSPVHDVLVDMILSRGHDELIKTNQEKVHKLSIGKLKSIKQSKDSLIRPRYLGALAEATALCLLTRYAHPWMIAAPTLPHHEIDSGDKDRYDIAVAIDDGNTNSSHYLQVKTGCTSRCGNEKSQYINFGSYSSGIQFISGCCDLELLNDKESETGLSPSGLLIAEYYNKASVEQVKRLDNLTDNLIFNITADLLPRGTSRWG